MPSIEVKVQLIRDETSSRKPMECSDVHRLHKGSSMGLLSPLSDETYYYDEKKVSASALCHKVKLPVTQDKSRNLEFAMATFELGRPAEGV